MIYKKFYINKYKAINFIEIEVSNNLIPIIGINESGKTTILQAILAFDKLKDKYSGGKHLNHKNKYVLGNEEGSVSADVIIESKADFESIIEDAGLSSKDSAYRDIQEKFRKKEAIKLIRNFPSRDYTLEGFNLSKTKIKKLALAIYEQLPFILYFDDFSDRVPSEIAFVESDNDEGYDYSGKVSEWHSILEEIFKRATGEEHTLGDFLKMKTDDDKEGLLKDVQDTLHNDVIEDWKKLKQYGDNFASEPEKLQMLLRKTISDDQKTTTFHFKVEDRTTSKARMFDIGERSKGFQWFFNFIVKLKFNPKYQAVKKGAIYLLDEPGSYLHTSAQEELLKKLNDISNTNTILYCTHSQFLLDPDTINISRIKISHKEKGNINIIPYDSAGVAKLEGAMTPLYQALHIKLGTFNRKIKYAVVTEGITDYYFFNLLKKYSDKFDFSKIDFIPGGGAKHLRELISMSITFTKNYLILLDSDIEGNEAYESYKDYFGEGESKHFFKYVKPNKKTEVVLEDFLSAGDKKKIKGLTKVNDVKGAFPVLYYMEDKARKNFITNLDDITIKNLTPIKGKIEALPLRQI